MEIKIKEYQPNEFGILVEMADDLYPNYDSKDHLIRDLRSQIRKEQFQIYFAMQESTYVGFMMISMREDYVEGSSSSPTGYLEGIYVKPAFRKYGVARKLYLKAEQWVAAKGGIEIGSDTWLNNKDAQAFHLQLGFEEDDRLVHYIKKINGL